MWASLSLSVLICKVGMTTITPSSKASSKNFLRKTVTMVPANHLYSVHVGCYFHWHDLRGILPQITCFLEAFPKRGPKSSGCCSMSHWPPPTLLALFLPFLSAPFPSIYSAFQQNRPMHHRPDTPGDVYPRTFADAFTSKVLMVEA